MKSASKTAEMDGTKAAAMHGNMKQLERAESDRSLNEEHKSIKKLFGNYHAAEMKDRDDIAEDIILALHNHVCFEEQLLRYPVVATSVGETELLDRLFENQSKVNLAIDNLRKLFTDLDVSQYNDKMLQLEQCFDAHVDLAEKCMIPEFREKGIDFRELNDPAAQLCLPSEESSFPRHRFQPGIAAPEG